MAAAPVATSNGTCRHPPYYGLRWDWSWASADASSKGHYFRHVMAKPGTVHVTRPYLSLATAAFCVTVSIASQAEGDRRVLCGDLHWNEKPAASDRSVDTVLRSKQG